ncbi:3-dehydroquinate synthase [Thermodesulfobium acidiphilum]|uniref:3-dehydroquinate synthase n=2 Tax=Thermodesulfobium acidiphilum TaxID=1794699 RepID=A0A2R4W2H0_THEAF|nr:3-dehydroquinate synthase [Thermodesulfobium acidiphilum]
MMFMVKTLNFSSADVNVYFKSLDEALDEILEDGYSKVLAVTHYILLEIYDLKNTFKRRNIDIVVLPEGEKTKSLSKFIELSKIFFEHSLDRYSHVIVLGGGVLGDLCGFLCSVYMRGISFSLVPTTLLSMVDSSIGGKNGIDLDFGKNLLGSFYHPKNIVIDLNFLKSLPEREISSGMAEIIKYAILDDSFILDEIKKERPDIGRLVELSIDIKSRYVKEDEREKTGKRALLNLGHTLGHAIEARTLYSRFTHGEAISIGSCFAAFFSYCLGYANIELYKEIKSLFCKYNLPTSYPTDLDVDSIEQYVLKDKKNISSKIRFVIMKDFSDVFIYTTDFPQIKNCLLKWIEYEKN